MGSSRTVASSVVRTLGFHVATLVFACLLGTIFCVSGSALLLLVGCLLVGSSQFARKLTRFLWRTEMRIDALVTEDPGAVPATQGEEAVGGSHQRRDGTRSTPEQGRQQQQQQRRQRQQQQLLGEITFPVMLLSLLYFLLFKWILNLVFSVVPLTLWVVSIAQLLPANSALASMDFVATGTAVTQAFTALAFAFLAHQLGVTSARGLLYVSTMVSGMLFPANNDGDAQDQQEGRLPLVPQLFDSISGMSVDIHAHSDAPAPSFNYGTIRRGEQARQQTERAATASSSSPSVKPAAHDVARNLYQEGRTASEPSVLRPAMGANVPRHPSSFGGSEFPYASPMMPPMPPSSELPHAERAFRGDIHDRDQELQLCCCKVVVKANAKEDAGNGDRDDRRGGGGGGRGGSSGRGGGSRGGFGWGRGGGRAGLHLGRMRSEEQEEAPLPFPPFGGFPPWGGDWRGRGFGEWPGWQDWRWPGVDYRRKMGKKGRTRMRRHNSFDDVYAVAVPVAATTLNPDADELHKPAAHTSMYEALDLSPSAPPLPTVRPRYGSEDSSIPAARARERRPASSDDAYGEDGRRRHRHDSMHKSISEPGLQFRIPEYWRGAETASFYDSDEEDEDEEERDERARQVSGLSRNDKRRAKRDERQSREDALRAQQDGLRARRDEYARRISDHHRAVWQHYGHELDASRGFASDGGEVAGEGEWQRERIDGASTKKVDKRLKRSESKQKRYEKKVQRYEQKLRVAREKSAERLEHDADRQERDIDAKERELYAREIELAADEAFHRAEVDKSISSEEGAQSQEAAERKVHSQKAPAAVPLSPPPASPAPPTPPPAPSAPPAARPAPSASPAAPPAASAPPAAPKTRAARRQATPVNAGGDPRKRAVSSRVRGRPIVQTDQEVRSSRKESYEADKVERQQGEDKRSVSVTSASQAGSTHDINDFEIRGRYGSISRSYESDDVTNMRTYAPLSFTGSPPQYITTLDSRPIYRGSLGQPDYNSFSPMGSPRSTGTGRDSLLDTLHDYNALSPTNSLHDAEFPTDKFQQVYRSIQSAAAHQPRLRASSAAAEGGLDASSEFEMVSGRRDRVNFNAFAPPSVCPSPKPFQFTVWAFLLNQRAEMQERAQTEHPDSSKLSLETKLDVRRGALVHVTLEVPSGFRVLNGATQGFAWEGKISSVNYDVECTEGAAFGRVLFKARITVGASVAILNSFVLVGSSVLDPSELEADVLDGWMDVMEQTYREIPFRSLELKELVGQGYFGDAYRASLDGEDVVVKTIRASEFGETTNQIVREFQHEAAMLSMFGHHPCIVPFVGAATDTKFPLALVTKYLPFGSLEDNLRRSDGPSLSIDERTGMLKDAAAGLLNIHEGGFIHRDVAARNCLVDDGLHVRICDFGLCRRVRSETGGMLMKDAVGPVKYMAPESLQPPHAFSYDSDVYMFGVLMWETYTRSPPFAALTPVEAMMHVLRGERLAVPNDLPAPLQTLIQSCFYDSPADRPSMQEVLMTLDESLAASQRASAAIASAAAATATATAKSTTTRANLQSQQDRSIWV
ncbi:hypothetical protein BBJ28_00015232 [Nothophytophthora sp. Chile5]|nr:hypothetical protein BBJ28_00015232 [Nothophytophthora sp. Chile5]